MSKEEIFEKLVSLRTIIEKNPEFYDVIDESELVNKLQELIWKLGQDIGKF